VRSLWDDDDARAFASDPLASRVYTSRLIGQDASLVLHGGGNTSVKSKATDLFGDSHDAIWVKGSGWDLASIEAAGFAPLRMDMVRRMAELPSLSDARMVEMLRAALLDPNAPNPSVEAVLHAVIPFAFVDHTHADAVVTITNTPNGVERIGEIYGDRIFIVPYVMPGFILAREVYGMTRDIDWAEVEGIILLNHGVFTFGGDARSSYERMIQLVSEAEDYLELHAPLSVEGDDDAGGADAGSPMRKQRGAEATGPASDDHTRGDLVTLAHIRHAVSKTAGAPLIATLDSSANHVAFSSRPDVGEISSRGPLTPDHVIRTKRAALLVDEGVDDLAARVERYASDYREYFRRHAEDSLTPLDPAPRWVVWPGRGTVAFGRTLDGALIARDIVAHTVPAIERAELLGGWKALPEDDVFDVEYWELEQAKLKRAPAPAEHAGRVVVVTGAASGIGRATVDAFLKAGACVAALDVAAAVETTWNEPRVAALVCDVTDIKALDRAIESTVLRFGGIDVVVSNAGIFPPSARIADLSDEVWQQSLAVNLEGHRLLLKKTIPFLFAGWDPAIVVVGSKNVHAPGKGAAAYSVAKAGLTQLARVAALELASAGIRVNVLHPNDVFDTGIWTPDVLAARAREYGMDVEAYKRKNLLGRDVTSADVAALAVALAGRLFAATTGAQIPVDGGNDRVV
jgi:rhamnose utilization protein RhaD (predicted bifunctional aldolase and dehydrogenase)/NAD(P)-dependent dehydrogenase (short-subunit alcohol dehydrogenase family)